MMLALIILLEIEDYTGIDTLWGLPASFGSNPVVKVREVARTGPAELPVVG